jgi:WD40 repeat protein
LQERLWKWARRRPAAAALVAVSGAAAVGLGVLVTLLWFSAEARLRDEREAAATERRLAGQLQEERDRAERGERARREAGYISRMNLAAQWSAGGRTPGVLDALRPDLAGSGAEDLRGFEWFCSWRQYHRERYTRTGLRGAVFAAGGSVVATDLGDGEVQVWDLATGKPRVRLHRAAGTLPGSLAMPPDGRMLVSCYGDRVETEYPGVGGAAFTPDGSALIMGGTPFFGDPIVVLERASGRWLPGLKGALADLPVQLTLSPDGKTLAVVFLHGFGDVVRLWDMTRRKPLGSLRGHDRWASVTGAAFSPDGRRLATGDVNGRVTLWDAATRQEAAHWQHGPSVSAVAFSPDGKLLVSAGTDIMRPYAPGEVKVWDAASGEERAVLRGHSRGVTCLAFSPDGKRLATGSDDGTVQLWLPATGAYVTTLRGASAPVKGVAFRPDGRALAAVDVNGTVLLWQAAAPEEVKP